MVYNHHDICTSECSQIVKMWFRKSLILEVTLYKFTKLDFSYYSSCFGLQVVTNRETQEVLLCLAYIFEVSAERSGSKHRIYRLVKNAS